jgi:hypothetical protein
MVYRRRRYNRRPLRRRFRRLRTRRTYLHKPIGSGQFGRRFIKVRQMYTVQATHGSTPKIDYAFTDDPTTFSEWSNCVALFDKVRICAMKIKFIPHFNIPTPLDPTKSTLNVAMQYGLVCFDPNITESLTLKSMYYQYDNLKFMYMYRPWKYYVKYKKKYSCRT